MKIKKGDKVIVVAGKDRGKTGEVSKVFPLKNQVLIDGMNTKKRRKRARQGQETGTVLEIAMPIHASNVQLYDASSKKGTRVGYQLEKGKKVRVARTSGKTI